MLRRKQKIILYIMITILLSATTGCKKNENNNIKDKNLYEEAIQYIINNDNNPERNKERYKMFIDYEKFVIRKDKDNRYVYMWIAEESYYVMNNKIISSSGSSMPYKFTFDLRKNKVLKVELPKDGSYYASSIKEMYPDDLENRVLKFNWKNDKLKKEVKKYYSNIQDKNIYYYTGEDYIKLDN